MSIDDKVPIDDDSRFGGPQSVGLVETQSWTFDDPPLQLDCGRSMSPVTQAYEMYGQLSPERDNAILIFHALTGDAHVAGYHSPDDPKPGWWDIMVGPGKAFDTSTMRALQGLVKEKTERDISLTLSDKSIQCLGGVVVRDAEKHVEVDNTLEAKLDRLKGSIRVEVAKILFGDKL